MVGRRCRLPVNVVHLRRTTRSLLACEEPFPLIVGITIERICNAISSTLGCAFRRVHPLVLQEAEVIEERMAHSFAIGTARAMLQRGASILPVWRLDSPAESHASHRGRLNCAIGITAALVVMHNTIAKLSSDHCMDLCEDVSATHKLLSMHEDSLYGNARSAVRVEMQCMERGLFSLKAGIASSCNVAHVGRRCGTSQFVDAAWPTARVVVDVQVPECARAIQEPLPPTEDMLRAAEQTIVDAQQLLQTDGSELVGRLRAVDAVEQMSPHELRSVALNTPAELVGSQVGLQQGAISLANVSDKLWGPRLSSEVAEFIDGLSNSSHSNQSSSSSILSISAATAQNGDSLSALCNREVFARLRLGPCVALAALATTERTGDDGDRSYV